MNKYLRISFLLFSMFLTGCASTHGAFVTEHKNAWIDGYSLKSGLADKGLLYCMSNIKEESGLADPVCFETRFEEYEDEKSHAEEERKDEVKKKEASKKLEVPKKSD